MKVVVLDDLSFIDLRPLFYIRRYFFFLLFNVLLVFTLVSTIFKTLEQIFNHPAEVLNLLSTSLPAVDICNIPRPVEVSNQTCFW